MKKDNEHLNILNAALKNLKLENDLKLKFAQSFKYDDSKDNGYVFVSDVIVSTDLTIHRTEIEKYKNDPKKLKIIIQQRYIDALHDIIFGKLGFYQEF